MTNSIVQLLASEKLNGDNYATLKSNLNTILVIDDLMFVLTEEFPPNPTSNANKTVWDAYDRWTKANEKAQVYILASLSDVLAKKHDVMGTAKEVRESLKWMFGQPSFSLRHDAIKYIYNCRMKEGTSVREHVLDIMVHFNVAKENGDVIDEKSQVSFIMESLSKSFFQFRTNVMMNKIEYNLTALLNELQTYQPLLTNKGQKREASVAISKKLLRGSSSKNKFGSSTSKSVLIKKKGKGKIRFLLTANTRFKKQIKENVSIATKMGTGRETAQNTLQRRKPKRHNKVNMIYSL